MEMTLKLSPRLTKAAAVVLPPPVVDKVTLDIGGFKYVTSKRTLIGRDKSMLAAMFNGQFPLRSSLDEPIFVDRDGQYFRYILTYLRDGIVDPSASVVEQVALLREAEFYQLTGLVRLLTDKSVPLRSSQGQPRCYILSSSSLTVDEEYALTTSSLIESSLIGHLIHNNVSINNSHLYSPNSNSNSINNALVNPNHLANIANVNTANQNLNQQVLPINVNPTGLNNNANNNLNNIAPTQGHVGLVVTGGGGTGGGGGGGGITPTLAHGNAAIPAVRFSCLQSTGKYAMAGGSPGILFLFDLDRRKLLRRYRDHEEGIRCLYFCDNLVVSGGHDLRIKGRDMVSGQPLFSLQGAHKIMITTVHFKDDILVSGSLDGTVIIWDLGRQRPLHTLSHNNTVFSVQLVHNLLVTECGAAIFIYNSHSGACVQDFKQSELVHCEGTTLIFYTQKPSVFSMWDLSTMEHVRDWKKICRPHVEASARYENLFATGSEDGEIQVYDLDTGNCLRTFSGQFSFIGLQLVNTVLLSGSKDGKIIIWDVETGERIRTFYHCSSLVSFRYDHDRLVCAYEDEIRIWDFSIS